MKVAFLIKHRPHMVYFVHELAPLADEVLLIIESKEGIVSSSFSFTQKIRHRIQKEGIWGMLRTHILHQVSQLKKSAEERSGDEKADKAMEKIFKGRHKHLPDIRTITTCSINDQSVIDALKEFEPDAILDHGTSIVKESVFSLAPLALNLHWGLSPYYRGSYCTNMALLNWDPLNIGVTVHSLAPEVDGGGIVGQARAHVSAFDTARTINAQLTVLGTDILKEVLQALQKGKKITFHTQTLADGFVSMSRQWHSSLDEYLHWLYESGSMKKMMDKPAREALPIVTFHAE